MIAGARGRAALAAAAYLAVSLWAVRSVWPDPTRFVPAGAERPYFDALIEADQQMVLATVAGNARSFAHAPGRLLDGISCHPLPHALALGEHMLGFGLLATLPLALTDEPVLAYDAALVASLWIAALAMYALVLHLTGSGSGAFLAGLFFSYARLRLEDPAHPFGHGDLWAPLLLLFLFRLFERRDWTSAAGVALFGVLQMGESAYALLSTGALVVACLALLAARAPRVAGSLAPKLGACAAVALTVGGVLFAPYLEIGKTWVLPAPRGMTLLETSEYLPGHSAFFGWIVLAAALVGLLDRLRGPRNDTLVDPRVALALTGALLVWCTLVPMPLPTLGIRIPSPLQVLRPLVPGLDLIRVLPAIRMGAYLSACVLAGYGVRALVEKRARVPEILITSALALAWVAELDDRSLATASFGTPLASAPRDLGVSPSDRRLLERIDEGAVLDYPPTTALEASAHQLRHAAFHGQAVAACYNSRRSPLLPHVRRLAAFFPDRHAAEALEALGFRSVLVHFDQIAPDRARRVRGRLAASEADRWIEIVGETPDHVLVRLVAPTDVVHDCGALQPGDPEYAKPADIESGAGAELSISTYNPTPRTFRPSDPITPAPFELRWESADRHVQRTRVLAVPPLAVAPGQTMVWKMHVPVDVPPGRYDVSVACEGDPPTTMGRGAITVRPATEPTSQPGASRRRRQIDAPAASG